MIKIYATLNIEKKIIKIRNFDHIRNFELRNNDQGRLKWYLYIFKLEKGTSDRRKTEKGENFT